MEFNELVEEIVRRVVDKIAVLEQKGGCCKTSGEKPKLLLISQEHTETCHTILKSEKLGRAYQLDCALEGDFKCELDDYDAVILFQLTCDALAKIASGTADSCYTALASKAILMGKKIFVPKEEVELFRYRESAPKAYYDMMLDKLNVLGASELIFCRYGELEDAVLNAGIVRPCGEAAPKPEDCCTAGPMSQREVTLNKRVVTERDIIEVCMDGATCLMVGPKTIVTDLARDYAKKRRLDIMNK